MPRRASFAEISRSVTKNKGVSGANATEPLRKRSVSSAKLLKKSKFSEIVERNLNRKKDSKKAGGEKGEQDSDAGASKEEKPTPTPEPEALAGKAEEDGTAETAAAAADNEEGGEDIDAELVVLGGGDDEAAAAGEDDEEKEEDEAEEERKAEAEAEANRKQRFKKMTKKQRLLEEERLEEERARNARRARRAERKRKKEEQEELAKVEAPQSLDEVAFKESVYELVKTALNLTMNQETVNITVDNLPQLMKGFELDAGDEDIKDMIMEALLDSYGIIEPSKIDELILKKQMEKELDELEECVDTAFAVIDQDRDGIITQNDVYRLMIHLGEVLWDTQVAAILNAADVDGDGKISKKDLFLFLLGQEKTVKVEDQILSKFGGGNATGEDSKEAESTTPEDTSSPSATVPAEEPSPAPAAATTTTTTSLAATLKATELPEDVAAAARRRRMMSGYSKLANVVKAISNSGPGHVSKDTAISTSVQEPVAAAAVAADAEEKVGQTKESPAPPLPPEVTTTDASDESSRNDSASLPAAPKVSASDWSDSGHDTCPNDSDGLGQDDNDDDDESQFDCGPMALDANIAYLPAPEFCSLASPRSPRTPRSRRSSCSRQSASPRPKSRENLQCGSPSTNVDLDPTTEAMASARTEQTSEYDSEEREGTLVDDNDYNDEDDDVLPETSQQNRILREIEKQVLHTKKALAQTKGVNGPLKDRYAARTTTTTTTNNNNNNCDPADGCESVVESEIHPVYVPPCAREVSRSRRFRGSILDAEEWPGSHPKPSLGDLTVAERSKFRSDKNRLETPVVGDDYATSTSEILSKGYVSLSTPRSLSTLATAHKPPPVDAYDDDGLLPGEDAAATSAAAAYGGGFRDILVPANFVDFKMQAAMKDCQCGGAMAGKVTADDETPVVDTDADFDVFEDEGQEATNADMLVDGVPSTMRPTCERARMLSARKEHPSPLRRSLTCHVVTVKDLSLSLNNSPSGSPARREFHRQSSMVGKHSFSPHSKESPSRREPSGSPAFLRRQLFSTSGVGTGGGGAAQSNKTGSPLSHAGRMYSPSNRADTYRTASNVDSARSGKEPSTYWASARSHRDSSRSQKDTWRGLRSHLSRRDSFREKLTARSGDRTNRSQRSDREKDGEEADPEEEFRFCGPNFDAIMNKKGEPEELLQESLYRDAIARSGEAPPEEIFNDFRPPTHRGVGGGGGAAAQENAPAAPGESRKFLISRQLERVKQMEALILQKRSKLGTESDEDDAAAGVESAREVSPRGHHPLTGLRRSKSTLHIRVASPDQRAHDTVLSTKDVARWVADGASPCKTRPKSCMADRRRGVSASSLRVVTISDGAAGRETSTIRDSSQNASPARASPARASSARLDSPGRMYVGSPGRLDSPGRMYVGSPARLDSPGRMYVDSPGRASNAGSPARPYFGSPGRTSNAGSPARAYIGSPGRMSNTGSPARAYIGSPGRASNATESPGRVPEGHPDVTQEDVHEEPKVHVVDLTSLLDKVNEPDAPEEDSLQAPYGDGDNYGSGGAVAGVGGVGESDQQRNKQQFKPLARMLVAYERARRRQANVAAGSSQETSISRKLEQGIPYRPPSPPRQPLDDRSPAGLSRWHRRRKDNSPHYDPSTTTTTITAGANHVSEIDAVNAAQRRGLAGATLQHQSSSACFVLSADQVQDDEEHHHHHHHPLVKSFLEAVEKHEADGSPFSGAHGHSLSYGARAAAANSSVNFEFPERSVCVLKPKPVTTMKTENS